MEDMGFKHKNLFPESKSNAGGSDVGHITLVLFNFSYPNT